MSIESKAVSADTVLRRSAAVATSVSLLLGFASAASALELPTGNDDLAVHWDNTVRYNVGMRASGQDGGLLGNPNLDDGDRNFSSGSLVTNRLDLLSEFDLVWKRQLGFRISGAGWRDFAYDNLHNTNTATANTLVDGLPVAGILSDYTKRYSQGTNGELLDAFTFANFDAGGVPVNVKVGQHTVYWGESLLLGGAIHGISYGQNSLDAAKGFATPGTEAKELFRPRGGITIQAQPVPTLSLAAQWFYNWQAIRVPESGNYLTVNDSLQFGGDSAIVGKNPYYGLVPGAPPYLRAWNETQTSDHRFSASIGDYGLSMRWNPTWLGGTLGLYFRNTTDIVPQQLLTPGVVTGLPAATCTAIGGSLAPGGVCIVNKAATNVADLLQKGKFGTYSLAYGNDIHILGLSLAKEIAGVSVGAELSYRTNMPLISDPVKVLPAPLVAKSPGSIATTDVPSEGTPGARGDTMHGLVNLLDVLPKTPVFDTATVAAEFTWSEWLSVTDNENVFRGRSTYTALDRVSKNYFGLAVNFTPTWYEVFPSVDLLAPVTWSQGLSGNSAVLLGGNHGAGTWSAGVAADIRQRYRFDLKYTGYFGPTTTDPITGAVTVANGTYAAWKDRGWVSLTFKTTF